MQKEFFKLAEQSSESEFTINRSQFAEALKIVAIKAADQEILDKLFTLFDKTGDGQVNFRQFVIGASVLVKGTTEEKLQCKYIMLGEGTRNSVNGHCDTIYPIWVIDCTSFIASSIVFLNCVTIHHICI